LNVAGSNGLSKEALVVSFTLFLRLSRSTFSRQELRHTVPIASQTFKAIQEAKSPLAYWVGYESPTLVSASHIHKWGIVLSNRLVLPRRWIDLLGNIMQDTWEAACRAVVGTVSMRPGITEVRAFGVGFQSLSNLTLKADLKNRLRPVYDACDIAEVLDHLTEMGVLRKVIHLPCPTFPEELAPAHLTFWLTGPRGPWAL